MLKLSEFMELHLKDALNSMSFLADGYMMCAMEFDSNIDLYVDVGGIDRNSIGSYLICNNSDLFFDAINGMLSSYDSSERSLLKCQPMMSCLDSVSCINNILNNSCDASKFVIMYCIAYQCSYDSEYWDSYFTDCVNWFGSSSSLSKLCADLYKICDSYWESSFTEIDYKCIADCCMDTIKKYLKE